MNKSLPLASSPHISSVTNNNLWIVGTILAVLVYCIGSYINWKIICICRKVKDKTWQVDVAHSVGMMTSVFVVVVFEKVADHVAVLSDYTGAGICYIVSFIYSYGAYIGGFHSFHISMMKYVYIVHYERVRRFGEEKLKKIFFWAYILHPLILTIPTVILLDLEVYTSLFQCLGLQQELIDRYKSNSELSKMFLCKLNFDENEEDNSISYMLAQSFCGVKMIWILILSTNFPEGYMYFKIFRHMKRYFIFFIISFISTQNTNKKIFKY